MQVRTSRSGSPGDDEGGLDGFRNPVETESRPATDGSPTRETGEGTDGAFPHPTKPKQASAGSNLGQVQERGANSLMILLQVHLQ